MKIWRQLSSGRESKLESPDYEDSADLCIVYRVQKTNTRTVIAGVFYTVDTFNDLRACIQKFPDWVNNEINNNKHSLRSNTKGYGVKTY